MDFYIKQHDRREALECTLLGSDGAAVNLTGATAKFFMRDRTNALAIDQAATIVTPASGLVRYSWGVNETATPGNYRAEFEVTFGDGTKQTFPNDNYIDVHIVEDLN